jgi:DNA-binding response OmpR family regulator
MDVLLRRRAALRHNGAARGMKQSARWGHSGVSAAGRALPGAPEALTSWRNREKHMTALKKILMVDDDSDLREALADQLVATEEFDVFEAGDGADGLSRAKGQHYDLVILDVGLPDMDGRELCRLMRKQGVKCPILMLTGHATDNDTVQGLDAGANDYVAKPFKLPVLLARIRAQLRQHEQSEDAVFAVGPYTFKPAAKLLLDDREKKIRLTERRRTS